jgi:hypothetical protein
MASTDSDRLLAAGKTITFADGSDHALRFAFRGLKMIEDEFGSITGISEAIQSKEITTLVRLIAIGLRQENVTEDGLLDLLDSKRLVEYGAAVMAALEEALPSNPTPVEAPDPEDADPTLVTASSNGSTGTTPPPFALVGATPTSGN